MTVSHESGTFRGRRAANTGSIPRGVSKWGRPQPHVKGSRGERLNRGVRCSGEVGVPAVEVVGELVVEDAGADLNEQMGTAWVQRICCFFTMRLLITWFTADSVNAVEIASPARRRSL